jgi:acyl-CoA hydrolase
MTQLVMPNDTNHLGNLMGGNLMKWMDIACAMCASRHAQCAVVTASVDNISFKSPIRLGEICILNAWVTRAFNTSLEVFVEVFAENAITGEKRRANDAYFTFVGMDLSTQRPNQVAQIIPESEREQKLYEGASRRRELRLILSGRLKPSEATLLKDFFQQE